MHVGGGASYQRVPDVEVHGSINTYALTRSYISREDSWYLGSGAQSSFLPKPFGANPSNPWTLNWWHSLYSFVYTDGWTVGSSVWTVRTLEGAVVQYIACSSGPDACFAQLAPNSRATNSKLYWAGSGNYFIFFHQGGMRFVYADAWTPPAEPSHARFFITRIEDKQYPGSGSPRVLASVQYGIPVDGSCPGLDASPNGVPYVQSLTTEDGAQLRFQYKRLPASHGLVPQECVLDSVSLVDRQADGGSAPVTVAQYSYVLDGGTETAGLLSSVAHPISQQTEAYAYADGGLPIFATYSNGTLTSYHEDDYALQVRLDRSLAGIYAFAYSGSAPCGSGSAAATCRYAQTRHSRTTTARGGGFTSGSFDFSRDYLMHWTNFSTGPKLYEYEDTCVGLY